MAQKKDIEDSIESLKKIGLNEYQAKTLVSLLVMEEATGPQLSEFSRIPQARIYSVLDGLIEMNTVRKKPGRPLRYQIINPIDIADNIILWNRRKLEEKISSYDKECSHTKNKLLKLNKLRVRDEPRDFIEVIPAGEASIAETKKAIKNSKKEILIISNVMEYLPQIQDELKKAVKRKVKLLVLLNNPINLTNNGKIIQADTVKILENIGAQMRCVKETPLRMTLMDDSFSVFSVREDKEFLHKKDMIISKHKNMIKALRKYFENEWKMHTM